MTLNKTKKREFNRGPNINHLKNIPIYTNKFLKENNQERVHRLESEKKIRDEKPMR